MWCCGKCISEGDMMVAKVCVVCGYEEVCVEDGGSWLVW